MNFRNFRSIGQGHAMLTLIMVLLVSAVKCEEEVGVKWGVADTTATVGRPFRLHIPSDAFTVTPLEYTIRISEGEGLPAWLEFDSKENVLRGIPTPKDAGQVDLEIVGKGAVNEASTSCSILVRNVQSHTSGSALKFKKSGPEFVRCKRDEPETVATIILDTDMESLSVPSRLSLLGKFLGHMELQEDMVKMIPVGKSPMRESSALVSGTGDCTAPQTSGTFISWPVGCGQVKEGHFPILQRLDDDSTSGRMAKVLEIPVIGWDVTNSHIRAPKRKRRQAMATSTPVMTPVAPTKTDTSVDTKTDDGMDKLTRTVIDMESPTMIKPTATQPEMTKTDEPVMPPVVKETDDMIKPTVVEPPTSETKPTPPIKPTQTYTEDKTDIPVIPLPDPSCIPGQRPKPSNTFTRLVFQVGNVIDFLIPEDAFEDCEVGDTRGLELSLFFAGLQPIPADFFLKLDKENQKLVGLPLEADATRYKMVLAAKKMKGQQTLLANFNFLLVIKARKNVKKINHELSVTIDFPFDQFKSSVVNQTNLVGRVARVYGDPDSSNLAITKLENGSVVLGWANKTAMSSTGCPVEDVKNMVAKLVNKNGSLTQEAITTLEPFYLKGAAAAPAGACENNPDFPAVTSLPREKSTKPPMTDAPDVSTKMADKATTMKPKTDSPKVTPKKDDMDDDTKDDDDDNTDKVVKGGTGDDDDDDVLITTVVPAIVIVVILLIALLIACILYRKKRKGKMNVEEQNTFVNKGAPVIFPDELEDKPSDVNKPLLVEGGSPAPPPEYHRGTSESPEPANNHRNNYNNVNNSGAVHDDGIQELPERPYEPPAPPVTGSGANKQPRPTQQPLSQPPQILP